MDVMQTAKYMYLFLEFDGFLVISWLAAVCSSGVAAAQFFSEPSNLEDCEFLIDRVSWSWNWDSSRRGQSDDFGDRMGYIFIALAVLSTVMLYVQPAGIARTVLFDTKPAGD
jgi:hypothetical protein